MIEHRLNRREFLAMAAVTGGGALLAACAPAAPVTEEPKEEPAAEPEEEPTLVPEEEITLVMTHWGGEAESSYMQSMADQFMEMNPNITIDRLNFPDNYDEKLLTMIAGGEAPDIQATLRFTYFNFVAKRVVLNLQPHLDAQAFNRDEFYDVGLRPYTFRGNLYGLPREIDEWIIFYNKDLFDEAGVDYPTGDWSWDDLIANAKKLTKRDADGRATQFGFGYPHLGGAKAFDCFLYQNGGALVDDEDDPTEFTMQEPAALEAVQWMADLVLEHGVMPSPQERTDLGSVNDLFMSGQIAMRYGEFWSNLQFQSIEGFEWDVAEPAHGAKKATWVGGACYTVNPESENPDEAVSYVMFAAGAEGAKTIADSLAGVPAVKEVAESPRYLEHDPPPENLQATLDVFPYGVQPPMIPTFPEWNRLILSALDAVWVGDATAEEAIMPIVEEAQALMEEGREMLEGI